MKEPTRHALAANQIHFNEAQWHLLEQWVALLLEANKKLNLISRKDTSHVWEKHILHSLALLAFRKIEPGSQVCDIGTGGGLPGVPLAIACPQAHFILMDSTQKKIKALQSMIAALSLPNVQAVAGRAEELGKQPDYQHRFSVFTAKAVADLQSLERWTRPLRASTATLHVYKGGDLRQELQALAKVPNLKAMHPTLLELKDFPQFAENQKYIVSLSF